MATILDCQKRIENILGALIEVAHVQRVIDEHAMEAWSKQPIECVPELFQPESPSGEKECTVPDLGKDNIAHREFARDKLLELRGEIGAASGMGDEEESMEYQGIGLDLGGVIESIDVKSTEPLVVLQGLTDLTDRLTNDMLREFDSCMREG